MEMVLIVKRDELTGKYFAQIPNSLNPSFPGQNVDFSGDSVPAVLMSVANYIDSYKTNTNV